MSVHCQIPAHPTRKAMSKPALTKVNTKFSIILVGQQFSPRQRTSVHERSFIGPLSSFSVTGATTGDKVS